MTDVTLLAIAFEGVNAAVIATLLVGKGEHFGLNAIKLGLDPVEAGVGLGKLAIDLAEPTT